MLHCVTTREVIVGTKSAVSGEKQHLLFLTDKQEIHQIFDSDVSSRLFFTLAERQLS